MLRRTPASTLAALVMMLALATCRGDQAVPPTGPAAPTAKPDLASLSTGGSATLVGAGNIARCNQPGDDSTAKLLDTIAGTVVALGDNEYDNAALTQYQQCYGPSWGRQLARTSPAPGDKEYKTPGAAGYFNYFDAAAGDPSKGYYSYDLGSWHVIVLNSGTNQIPTTASSPQVAWLRADLAAHPVQCTVAYWDRPLFDSHDKPYATVKPLWDALYAGGVDVVLNAHYGFYERFAPQRPDGKADPAFGIREFVVGTGGAVITSFGQTQANSEVRNSGTFGVLALTLNDGSYSWQFVPVTGKSFTDSGSGSCHGTPPITVNAGPDQTASPGSATALSVSFSDPSVNAGPWAYTITWGDGNSSTGTATASPISASHTYAATGRDTVQVNLTNSAGGSGVDSVNVTIAPYVVFVGAGDIADCTRNQDSLTANLMDTIPGTVFVLGDNAYPHGAANDYANCYDPTWGRFKARTKPAPGNHEYETSGAAGYFGYFGAVANPTNGYYSYDYGGWHIIVVNSEIAHSTGSTQEQWVKADLAAHPAFCTLAYWHHPYWSSNQLLGDTSFAAIMWDLYNAGAEIVMMGHHHDYERFAPQSPDSVADPAHGIREFVAGTGGESLFGFAGTARNSEVRNASTYGVLELQLQAGGYTWKFIPIAGQTFTDAGSGTCHNPPSGSSANNPPQALAGGPYTAAEGATITFDGSGSSDSDGDSITYAWNFGDSTIGTGIHPTHAYVDNGSYRVTLVVTDAHGAQSDPATATATITNAAPVVNAGPDRTATAASPFTLNASFTDAGALDGPWAYSISWGDGSPPTTGSVTSQAIGISATHTYAIPIQDSVTVTVTDKDGGSGSDVAIVTVTAVNAPPTAAPGGPYAGSEGTPVTFDGSRSADPDGDTLTYAWVFGDGSTGAGVRPTHTYADNGAYTVTLTVTDARGASSPPESTTATINNVAPTISAGPDRSVTAGSPLTVSASFSDPGSRDNPWAWTIDWGDGSPASTGSTTGQANPITATHTYTTPGNAVVQVTVTDKDGGAGTGSFNVFVGQALVSTVLTGAGNISRCTNTNDDATAAMLDTVSGAVFALGDNAFPGGTSTAYSTCYDPNWGRQKSRTYPVIGNHEYDSTTTADGYFGYFGAAAGNPGQGYYSFDYGAWHVVVLNSNNAFVSTAVGSPQETWLRADLAATTKQCVLALFHHPRFYSTTASQFFPTASVKPFWDDLYAAHAELIVNAHMRDYERFAPQNSNGTADPNGIREFVVGTGGEGLDAPNTLIIPNSEVNLSGVYGVLQLTLNDGSYTWRFIPAGGATATDSGSGTCH